MSASTEEILEEVLEALGELYEEADRPVFDGTVAERFGHQLELAFMVYLAKKLDQIWDKVK